LAGHPDLWENQVARVAADFVVAQFHFQGRAAYSKAKRKAKRCLIGDETLFLEPENEVVCPRVDIVEGWLVGQPDPMAALLVNVQRKRHARFSQC
jgi:hypothetical protein